MLCMIILSNRLHKISLNQKSKFAQSMQVSTWLLNIAFHLHQIWLQCCLLSFQNSVRDHFRALEIEANGKLFLNHSQLCWYLGLLLLHPELLWLIRQGMHLFMQFDTDHCFQVSQWHPEWSWGTGSVCIYPVWYRWQTTAYTVTYRMIQG